MNLTVPISFFDSFPVSCGTTTRHFPLKIANSQQLAQQDGRSLAQQLLNLETKGWVQAGQIHGAAVTVLDGQQNRSSSVTVLKDTDGLITQTPNQLLSVVTADCLPIFFYLENPPSIGLVHAGWRGTARWIVRNAVSLFQSRFNMSPRELYVAFGPSIGGCCYEVGSEVRDLFSESLEERQSRLYLDLVKENGRQLLEAGVRPQRIGPAGPCCGCHLNDFYSYRKEGDGAYRMLSWITLSNLPKL